MPKSDAYVGYYVVATSAILLRLRVSVITLHAESWFDTLLQSPDLYDEFDVSVQASPLPHSVVLFHQYGDFAQRKKRAKEDHFDAVIRFFCWGYNTFEKWYVDVMAKKYAMVAEATLRKYSRKTFLIR